MFFAIAALALAADPPSVDVMRRNLPDVVGEVRPGPTAYALGYETTTPRGILFTTYDDYGEGPVVSAHFYEQLLPTSVSANGVTIGAYVQQTAPSDADTNGPKLGKRSEKVDAGAYVPGVGIFEWRIGGDPELVLPMEFAPGKEWMSGELRHIVVSTDVTARWVEGDGIWTAEHCLAIGDHPVPYDGFIDFEYRCPNGYGVVAAWRDYPERGERIAFFKAKRMFWKVSRAELPTADGYRASVARTVAELPQRATAAATPASAAVRPLAGSATPAGGAPGASPVGSTTGAGSSPSATTTARGAAATGPVPIGGGLTALFPGVDLRRGRVPWEGQALGDNGWGDTVWSAPLNLLGVPGAVVWSTCDAGGYEDDAPDATGRIVERLDWSVAFAGAGAGVPEAEVVHTLPPPYQRGDETAYALRTARVIMSALRAQGWTELGPFASAPRAGADRDETLQFARGDERLNLTMAVLPGKTDPLMRVGVVELEVVTGSCPAP